MLSGHMASYFSILKIWNYFVKITGHLAILNYKANHGYKNMWFVLSGQLRIIIGHLTGHFGFTLILSYMLKYLTGH